MWEHLLFVLQRFVRITFVPSHEALYYADVSTILMLHTLFWEELFGLQFGDNITSCQLRKSAETVIPNCVC